jgi:prepilin-type processing-associated H-X9-DG protein
MRKFIAVTFTVASCAFASSAFAQGDEACVAGVYHSGDHDAVILARHNASDAMNYLFLDGRSGKVSDADNPFRCREDSVMTRGANGAFMVWRKVNLQAS